MIDSFSNYLGVKSNIFNCEIASIGTLKGIRVVIFKTLPLSKVVYLALLTVVPNHIIDKLINIQSNFILKNTPAKIKQKFVILDHKQGGLKCDDVTVKIWYKICLQMFLP